MDGNGDDSPMSHKMFRTVAPPCVQPKRLPQSSKNGLIMLAGRWSFCESKKPPKKLLLRSLQLGAACRLGSLSGGRQSNRPKRVVGQCKRFCAKSPDALLFGRVLFCSPVSSGLVATMLLRPSMPPRGNLFSVSDCVTWLHLPLWLGFSRQRF